MKCFLINIGHICTSIYVDIQSMSTVCDIYTQSELWTCEYYRRFDEYCQKKKKKVLVSCAPPVVQSKTKKQTTMLQI